jgi:putative transposase
MRGLKNHEASERSCREYGELRDLLRPRRRYSQIISATLRRSPLRQRCQNGLNIMRAISKVHHFQQVRIS